MSNYALSRLERLYMQVETTYGIVPNTTGTATVAGSNCCRFVKMSMDNTAALIIRPDKTGTRSAQIGVLGRKMATFSIEMSIAPNGTPGVAPDADPLFQAMMGQPGTAIAGTATVTAASNASPIVLTATNTFAVGDAINVSGVTGNSAANGVWYISAVTGTTITLSGSQGNGAYVSGGTVSRVSWKYTLSDAIPSLSLWSFRQPSTVDQRVAQGSVVKNSTISIGNDVASVTFAGESMWTNSSNQFSGEDLIQQGGLTTFPTEPGTPVTNGNIIAGFTGHAVVDGYTIATLRTVSIDVSTANETVKDTFGSYYPTSAQGDVRGVSVALSIYEDDSAAFAALTNAANNRTPIQVCAQVGTISGSIMFVVLNNVQMAAITRDEQIRFIANFPAAPAHSSSLALRDELTIWMF